MRKISYLLVLIPFFAAAQPNGYYDPAFGLNGPALRVALHDIIRNHTSIGYSGLWTAFQQTDMKPDGKVWDIYSDSPGQTAPYEYTFIADQCGTYNAEGDCYNREHTFPESYFGGAEPMRSDIFMVYPTDGWVNNKRSNYPYGEVSNPGWTSLNGCRLGTNNYAGAPSGTAFEPIDSFKGDLARTYFYIASRYYSEDGGWSDWEMAQGAELKPWAIAMLLDWHHNDPVSQKEISRNNAAYAFQNNRNPFIDFPQFADCIWAGGDCSTLSVAGTAVRETLHIYPNPARNTVHIAGAECKEALTIEILNIKGVLVCHKELPGRQVLALSVADWAKGVYFVRLKGKNWIETRKLVIE